jgi:flagellar hook protein FlgE
MSIAQSGLQVAQTRLAVSANNVANNQTPGYQRETVQAQAQPDGGVSAQVNRSGASGGSLEQDVVDQLAAKNDFLANLHVFKTADQMMGSLLDTHA